MQARLANLILITSAGLWSVAPAQSADDYTMDGAHASVTFKIMHMGISWTHGRFNDVSGTFAIDAADAAKCSFNLSIKTESIDTGNKDRDGHLRKPDFFNVEKYATMTFKSTAVKAAKDNYEVTGDLTLLGKTKSVTFTLTGGKKAEMPKGTHRIGYSTDLKIKRSDFGMDKGMEGIGDEVSISISFEGTKK